MMKKTMTMMRKMRIRLLGCISMNRIISLNMMINMIKMVLMMKKTVLKSNISTTIEVTMMMVSSLWIQTGTKKIVSDQTVLNYKPNIVIQHLYYCVTIFANYCL